MSSRPSDGSAEEGLSNSLLRFVEEDQIVELRHALSDFNHRCRNLLNGMKMSFYLAKRSSPGPLSARWTELDQTYRSVERLLDQLSSIYRNMPLSPILAPFGSLAVERGEHWRAWFERQGKVLTLNPPQVEAAGEMDAMRLVSAIDGFIAWRAEAMPRGGRASFSWSTDGGWIELVWTERPAEAPSPEPTESPRPSSATMGSLSLPLLARVVAEHRGRLVWNREPTVEARLRWPLAPSETAPRTTEARTVAVR